jgi:hypothetical protein
MVIAQRGEFLCGGLAAKAKDEGALQPRVSAIAPTPTAHFPKKCRRVLSWSWSGGGESVFMALVGVGSSG